MEANTSPENHKLSLDNRERLQMSGVKEVITFNDAKIVLQTSMGMLEFKGKNLNIQQLNLDEGNIDIKGTFNELIYSNKTAEKNFFKKLFK